MARILPAANRIESAVETLKGKPLQNLLSILMVAFHWSTGSVTVYVTNDEVDVGGEWKVDGQMGYKTLAFYYEADSPKIDTVKMGANSVEGSWVTIEGANFLEGAKVYFDTTEALPVYRFSAMMLAVPAPTPVATPWDEMVATATVVVDQVSHVMHL